MRNLETQKLRNLETSRANNLRILRIKNANFLGYCFCKNTNIQGDFQICISVLLNAYQKILQVAKVEMLNVLLSASIFF